MLPSKTLENLFFFTIIFVSFINVILGFWRHSFWNYDFVNFFFKIKCYIKCKSTISINIFVLVGLFARKRSPEHFDIFTMKFALKFRRILWVKIYRSLPHLQNTKFLKKKKEIKCCSDWCETCFNGKFILKIS